MAARPRLSVLVRHTFLRRQVAAVSISAKGLRYAKGVYKPSPGKTSSTGSRTNSMDRQPTNNGRPPKRRANSQMGSQQQNQQFQGGADVDQDFQLPQDFSSFPQPYPGMLPFMNLPAMGLLPQFPNLQQPAFMPDQPQFNGIPWQSYPMPFHFMMMQPMMDPQQMMQWNGFTSINQLQCGGQGGEEHDQTTAPLNGFMSINQPRQRRRGREGGEGEEHHQLPATAAAVAPRSLQPGTTPHTSSVPTSTGTGTTTTDTAGPPQPGTTPGRDPIVPPSAESGGVPEPTAAYLAQAAGRGGPGARQLRQPQPLLVVLDLNGTLLHRPNRKRPTHFVARRHAGAFLDYLLDTFWVVIWSSARPGNIASMTERLLTPAQRARLVAVWSRDNFGLSRADYGRRVQCYKRLSALWRDPAVSRSHPGFAAGKRWSQANTVLVDDSAEKARSEPYNLVRIPEFVGQVEEREREGDGDSNGGETLEGREREGTTTTMTTTTSKKPNKKQKLKARLQEEQQQQLRNGVNAVGGGDAAATAATASVDDGGDNPRQRAAGKEGAAGEKVENDDNAANDSAPQDVLPQVHDYINHLALQEDVSVFIKANPFQMKKDGWGHPGSTAR